MISTLQFFDGISVGGMIGLAGSARFWFGGGEVLFEIRVVTCGVGALFPWSAMDMFGEDTDTDTCLLAFWVDRAGSPGWSVSGGGGGGMANGGGGDWSREEYEEEEDVLERGEKKTEMKDENWER